MPTLRADQIIGQSDKLTDTPGFILDIHKEEVDNLVENSNQVFNVVVIITISDTFPSNERNHAINQSFKLILINNPTATIELQGDKWRYLSFSNLKGKTELSATRTILARDYPLESVQLSQYPYLKKYYCRPDFANEGLDVPLLFTSEMSGISLEQFVKILRNQLLSTIEKYYTYDKVSERKRDVLNLLMSEGFDKRLNEFAQACLKALETAEVGIQVEEK